MRFFHKLAAIAIPAVCLGLSSCGNSFEKTSTQVTDLQTDLAKRMLDCETADDVSAIVQYIDEATAEIKEITADIKAGKSDLIKEHKELTGHDMKHLRELELESKKAGALFNDGMQHMSKISGANMKPVQDAVMKYGEAAMELGTVVHEIEVEATK